MMLKMFAKRFLLNYGIKKKNTMMLIKLKDFYIYQ